MQKILPISFLIFFLSTLQMLGQEIVSYEISFPNAVHHEAEVRVLFSNIEDGKFSFRMGRSSPGRYAIHEFAKNVYNVKAVNSKGEDLTLTRPNPYQWDVTEHDGSIEVSYTLFANRGDGTYSQIDESHAHLNMPATFMFSPVKEEVPIEIKFIPREDLNWKVASQLKDEGENIFTAPNLQYFMDSPSELSNHHLRSFQVESNGKSFEIVMVLHDEADENLTDQYFEKVKKVVLQEKAVFGELPEFDFGKYLFLACYIPNASGDGMEHRNSTILTSTRGLAQGGLERNIGTVSHEFFHAWNVERIRPASLEPFDFNHANMSGELWFAEGFTSYYTNLILCRAGIISEDSYISRLQGGFNYVWNSPARSFFNPIEMSYQAPFVDAATSVDPVNRNNTFISYYSYGSVLGLALDLELRKTSDDLNLDDYMKLLWQKYGKSEKPYTIENLQMALNEYAGDGFGDKFFNSFIYDSQMPDYKGLFEFVGVNLEQSKEGVRLGASFRDGLISANPTIDSPAYLAGLNQGDKIIAIDEHVLSNRNTLKYILDMYKVGDKVQITFARNNKLRTAELTFDGDPTYKISISKAATINTEDAIKARKQWLGAK